MDNYEIPIRNLDLAVKKGGEYVLIFWNNDRTAFKEILTDEMHQVNTLGISNYSSILTPQKKITKDFFVPNFCVDLNISDPDSIQSISKLQRKNAVFKYDMGVFLSNGYEQKVAEKLTEKEIESFKNSVDRFMEFNIKDVEFENYKVENGWSFVGGWDQAENAYEAYYFKLLCTIDSYNIIMDEFMRKAKTIAEELNNGEFDADFIINGTMDLETLKNIAKKGLGEYPYLQKEKKLETTQNEEEPEQTPSPKTNDVEKYESLNF